MEYYNISCELMKVLIKVEDIKGLLNGDVILTEEIAIRLEKLFGCSKEFWLNLEDNYRNYN